MGIQGMIYSEIFLQYLYMEDKGVVKDFIER